MPLKLSLKRGETFVVNGAVVRNGDRRGVLLLETKARILRENTHLCVFAALDQIQCGLYKTCIVVESRFQIRCKERQLSSGLLP